MILQMNINLICYNIIVCSMLSNLTYALICFLLDNYVDGYKTIMSICFDLFLLNMLGKPNDSD